ncbi:hypothetical protein G9A89_017301 [Geosiphon pyriformis]|nr:hypothetical protein G9A89_017301 [Geosiphon pyriformis]
MPWHVDVDPLIQSNNRIAQAAVYLSIFNILFFMVISSYLRILFTNPGSPKNSKRLKNQEIPVETPPSTALTVLDPSSSSMATNNHTANGKLSQSAPIQSNSSTIQTETSIFPEPPIQPMQNAHVRVSSSELAPENIIQDSESPTVILSSQLPSLTPAPTYPLHPPTLAPFSQETIQMPSTFVSKKEGRLRFCEICNWVKPDRCHHCSECNACVLKMDHHCPWVNGCVGFNNYKFFYLFIFYTALYADFAFAATIPILVQQLRDNKDLDIQWIVLLILAFLFGLLLTGFTLVHTSYLFTNRTTIESIGYESRQYHVRVQFDANNPLGYGVTTTLPGENLWDLGWRNNFKSVMGNKWWLWFVPLGIPHGDGLSFPFNPTIFPRLTTNAKRQAQLQEDRMAMMIQHV